jgi:hypothetical protein
LNPETIHPTADDLKLIHNLNRLDKYIARSADYNEYEELLWDVQIGFSERFHLWLTNNGREEHQDKFANFTQSFFSFIYDYEHMEPLTLKSCPGRYFEEFMMDYCFRKTSIEALEYTLVPTAMRLLYIFLYEKGYLLEPPDRMIDFIDKLEPEFIENLKERFS